MEAQEGLELILVDGRPIEAEPLRASDSRPQGEPHELEIHLGAMYLWHELEQSDQAVTNRDLLSFVRADLRDHPLPAREAYLELAQRHRRAPPRIWEVLTGRYRKVRHVWECNSLHADRRTGDRIVFKGNCYRIEGAREGVQS